MKKRLFFIFILLGCLSSYAEDGSLIDEDLELLYSQIGMTEDDLLSELMFKQAVLYGIDSLEDVNSALGLDSSQNKFVTILASAGAFYLAGRAMAFTRGMTHLVTPNAKLRAYKEQYRNLYEQIVAKNREAVKMRRELGLDLGERRASRIVKDVRIELESDRLQAQADKRQAKADKRQAKADKKQAEADAKQARAAAKRDRKMKKEAPAVHSAPQAAAGETAAAQAEAAPRNGVAVEAEAAPQPAERTTARRRSRPPSVASALRAGFRRGAAESAAAPGAAAAQAETATPRAAAGEAAAAQAETAAPRKITANPVPAVQSAAESAQVRSVVTELRAIEAELDNLKISLKNHLTLRPGFWHRVGRLTRGAGYTAVFLGGFTAYFFIAGDALVLIVEGEDELELIKQAYTQDVQAIENILYSI